MAPPVETRKLTKKYGDITAVDALDLTLHTGEVYGFLGAVILRRRDVV